MAGIKRTDIGIKRNRGSLGIAKATHGEACVCRSTANVNRLNIDGIWSYICDTCFQTLIMLFDGDNVDDRTLSHEDWLEDIRPKGR